MKYDITIIGAGPAGSTLARILSSKYKVLLIDKLDPLFYKGKVCGGLLAPDAWKELRKQKIELPNNIFVSPQVKRVLAVDTKTTIKRYYKRQYVNIDRYLFDQYLLSLVPSNVSIWANATYKSYTEEGDYIKVHLYNNNERKQIYTKYLISAEGASSLIRNHIRGSYDSIERYICIQEPFLTSNEMDYYLAQFDSDITDYYSWAIQKNHELIIGSALKVSDQARNKFNLFKERTTLIQDLQAKPNSMGSQFLLRPRKMKDFILGEKKVFLIGEAAGFVSPSSGEEISYALKSAKILAKILNKNTVNVLKTYKKNSLLLRGYLLLKNIKSLVIYSSLSRMIVMKLTRAKQ